MARTTQKKIPSSRKVEILKRHLQGKEKVSDLCETYGVAPHNIYHWQNQLFVNGEVALERKNDRNTGNGAAKRYQAKIDAMESKIQQKNEVIGEMMEEIIKLKKSVGVI